MQKSHKKNRVIHIKSDNLDLRFELSQESPAFIAVNTPRPPYYSETGDEILLDSRETELISHLLELCSHYETQGEEHLSAIIERIGMSLMDFFLARASLKPNS